MYSNEIKKFKIKRDAVILAIESSCDETAAAIIKNGREILSSEISSLLNDMQQTNTALLRVVGTLTAQLNKPLKAAVDMWGHEGLYESLKKGEQFMKGKG